MVFRGGRPTYLVWLLRPELCGNRVADELAVDYLGIGGTLSSVHSRKVHAIWERRSCRSEGRSDNRWERKNREAAVQHGEVHSDLRFVGMVIASAGLLWQLNWAMMFTGFGLAGVGLYLGRQKEVSAGLDPAYTKLQKVGDEIRGEKGYVVRRVEKALQYSEGAHAVTLRSAQISIQVVGVPHPDGGVTKRKVVTIETGHFKVHWDSPNENQMIPRERLFEISSRMSEALNSGKVFYVDR